MDILYSVLQDAKDTDSLDDELILQTSYTLDISLHNAVVFSTSLDLLNKNNSLRWCNYVYVFDLNLPWDLFEVASFQARITETVWDFSGFRVLILTSTGDIQIWQMHDFILNDWECIHKVCITGEELLLGIWLHPCNNISFVPEKIDSYLYHDKFVNTIFFPSLRMFGGCAGDGVLALGFSGVISFIPLQNEINSKMVQCNIERTQFRISLLDYCYMQNGDLLLVLSSGKILEPIRLVRITVALVDVGNVTLSSKQMENFHVSRYDSDAYIDAIKFADKEECGPSKLFVCYNHSGNYLIEVWQLCGQMIPIHKAFIKSEPLQIMSWQLQAATSLPSQILYFAPSSSWLAVFCNDGTIYCLATDSLQQFACFKPSTENTTGKIRRLNYCIKQLCWTKNNCVLVALEEDGNIYTFKISPIKNGIFNLSWMLLCLEKCLITGWDIWDILIVSSSYLEQLADKMQEQFTRQPITVQQLYYTRLMSMRINILRACGSTHSAECYTQLMLYSVSSCCKALLRPADLILTQDKDLADTLTCVLNSKVMESLCDVDKAVVNLDKLSMECTVEPTTLQSIQQFIQWIADLSLYLLTSLPRKRSGNDIILDRKILTTLRELLLLIRMWGLVRSSCLPVFFKTSDGLDVLSILYRLVTRLLHSTDTLDESILDDCCLLSSQVFVPSLTLDVPSRGVLSPHFLCSDSPLQFVYGVDPESTNNIVHMNNFDFNEEDSLLRDTVHHVYIGADCTTYKSCTRCRTVAMKKMVPKSAATKAWDQKWISLCPCLGKWKMVTVASKQ